MSTRRWVKKSTWDADTDGYSPIPTRVVSNEEYLPIQQTREQARVAAVLRDAAARNARRLGVSRREFLGSSAGMASAFLAFNTVFGRVFDVDPVEALESAAADARKPAGQFVFVLYFGKLLLPGGGFLAQRLIRSFLQLRLERVNLRHQRTEPFDFPLVFRANNLLYD